MSYWSRTVCIVLLSMWIAGNAQAAFWQAVIERTDWRQHAADGRLIELDAVRELLERFEEPAGSAITIRYPGGDAGNAWAVQFRDRLVAYGIPSRFMEMIPGSGGLDILHVSLVDGE